VNKTLVRDVAAAPQPPPVPVTVVVPVYKGGEFVHATIESLLAQTYPALRILVICDGSPDAADHQLGQRYGARIDFFDQANMGLCATLNRAIDQLVHTPLIARCDQDDVSHPTRIEEQVRALTELRADACFTKINKVVQVGKVLAVHPDVPQALYAYDPEVHGAIVHSTLLARTDFLRHLGGYRKEMYPCDDFDLCLRMSKAGKVVVVGRSLVDYRLHDEANTFKYFWDMQTKTSYLLWSYRQTGPETSFVDWFEAHGRQEAASVRARVAGLGRLYYRQAGVRLGSGKYISGGGLLALSLLLSPSFTLGRFFNAARTLARRRLQR
jgi:glycosyltransferase involved in cell wall biosynthesis